MLSERRLAGLCRLDPGIALFAAAALIPALDPIFWLVANVGNQCEVAACDLASGDSG